MHISRSHERTKELALNMIAPCKLPASLTAGPLFSFIWLKQSNVSRSYRAFARFSLLTMCTYGTLSKKGLRSRRLQPCNGLEPMSNRDKKWRFKFNCNQHNHQCCFALLAINSMLFARTFASKLCQNLGR